jgi:pimeloyl-ACP methyl ester carboxylesterase
MAATRHGALALVKLVIGVSVFSGLVPVAWAQGESEKVTFTTVDEVELEGTYYPSSQGVKAPCALLLPNLKGTSRQPGWDQLAGKLQGKGYAVLIFDYRGHGHSTAVQPAFWEVSANRELNKKAGKLKKPEITFEDFHQAYYPMLVNDVAAARRFLERKNDARECNIGNLVVIGAQEGAALGALWLATEWRRHPPRKKGMATNQPPAGQDVAAAAWISITPTLGGGKSPQTQVKEWIRQRRDDTPMAFLYGNEDKASAAFTTELFTKVLRANAPPRPPNTAIKGFRTKAVGAELLNTKGVDDAILNYLDNVLESRDEQTWTDRETKKSRLGFASLKSLGFPFLP